MHKYITNMELHHQHLVHQMVLATGGNMTVVIDNLIKEGMVSSSDLKDRRVNLSSITEKGRQLVSEIFPKHVENISEIFSVLSTEEKNNLINILKKL